MVVGVGVTEAVAVGLGEGFCVGVTVTVAVGFGVAVSVGVTRAVAVGLGVDVGVAETVTVGTEVDLNVGVERTVVVGLGVDTVVDPGRYTSEVSESMHPARQATAISINIIPAAPFICGLIGWTSNQSIDKISMKAASIEGSVAGGHGHRRRFGAMLRDDAGNGMNCRDPDPRSPQVPSSPAERPNVDEARAGATG